MDTRDHEILIAHGRIALPQHGETELPRPILATLMANLTHYGYALNAVGFETLAATAQADVDVWWLEVEAALMALTGDDKDMVEHIVYKNFPGEVLAMDEADYWMRQVLMYWGLPNHLFTEEEQPREALDEALELRVLQPADEGSLLEVYRSLLRQPSRWTEGQWAEVSHLAPRFHTLVPLDTVPFKENQTTLAALMIELGAEVTMETATDVLRLAVTMSKGDPSLRENDKLRAFTRKERRALLGMLERARQLEEDVARRRERFKRLFRALRPGDYASRFPRTVAIYDTVYRAARIDTWNGKLESLLLTRDPAALTMLEERPGEFMRRLSQCLLLFGADAAGAFLRVMPKLSTSQLLKVLRHLETARDRQFRTFPPKGNWTKLQIRPADPRRRLPARLTAPIVTKLEAEIGARVSEKVGSVQLDPRTRWIKLQTNDSDLSPYGRGTVFSMPHNVTFLRTASYWASGPTAYNLWYDNGWNFFDDEWKPLGACCWTNVKFEGRRFEGGKLGGGKLERWMRGRPKTTAAVFSGDPTNSKDLEGRACQLIDLYLDELLACGVRYAVWNVLCYSHRTFDDAEEVLAALQWGEDPESGSLFEPARCQLFFPLRGPSLSKYIAYVDVKKRQVVYMDANLYSRVDSAAVNGKVLSATMPAFLEHLEAIPTVHDLFRNVDRNDSGLCVAYSDDERAVHGEAAYVFRPVHEASQYEPFDLNQLLT